MVFPIEKLINEFWYSSDSDLQYYLKKMTLLT